MRKVFAQFRIWLREKFRRWSSPTLAVEIVQEVPALIPPNVVFIIKDGNEADCIIFKCPCGCHADIYLNLLADTRPRWDFYFDGKKALSIHPSIWRTTGCRSHFFIRNGRIQYVEH